MTQQPPSPERDQSAAYEELRAIFKGKYTKENIMRVHAKVMDFLTPLMDTRGMDDMRKYKLFHLLSGSTPIDELSPELDLPNGEMERFIREEL